jgi:hypothetical protein
VDSRLWHCPTCDDVTEYVQPPCVDGHTDDGGECPEWVCVDCGDALLIGEVGSTSIDTRVRIAA